LEDIGMAKAVRVRLARRVAYAGLMLVYSSCLALGREADSGDDGSATVAAAPNLYLDLRTNYATFPAGSLSIGFGSFGVFNGQPALSTLASLANASNLATLPTLPAVSSPSSRSIGVDVPQIAWVPKPSYQLTVRTPLYLVKN
jgi:hypothetical protein